MFGKVKKWLGIEGVKLELVLPEMAFEEVSAVSGQIRFFSKNAQTVTSIRVVMVEKYTRGRGKDKLVDEYLIGEISLDKKLDVPGEDFIEIDFTLPFELVTSPVDEFEDKNLLARGLARAAKALRNVYSEYRIEAEATVEGTALNPFDRKTVKIVRT
ncbi:MAG: hypothetical protein ACE5FF_17250 [Saprospiraceae bacterium]